jgi:hypothetical protein
MPNPALWAWNLMGQAGQAGAQAGKRAATAPKAALAKRKSKR